MAPWPEPLKDLRRYFMLLGVVQTLTKVKSIARSEEATLEDLKSAVLMLASLAEHQAREISNLKNTKPRRFP